MAQPHEDITIMPQQSLQNRIQSLDDATAKRVLATFARAQPAPADTQLSPALTQALRDFSPEPAIPAETVSEGDLARSALLLLADDPQNQPILTALIEGPPPLRFGLLETTAIITAALVVLQIHIKFERDPEGRYSFKIEKKPADNALLKSLVQKLLSLLPS